MEENPGVKFGEISRSAAHSFSRFLSISSQFKPWSCFWTKRAFDLPGIYSWVVRMTLRLCISELLVQCSLMFVCKYLSIRIKYTYFYLLSIPFYFSKLVISHFLSQFPAFSFYIRLSLVITNQSFWIGRVGIGVACAIFTARLGLSERVSQNSFQIFKNKLLSFITLVLSILNYYLKV